MDRGEPLFCKYHFSAVIGNAPSAIAKAIDELTDAQLLAADQETLLSELVAAHGIAVPTLDLDVVEPSQREVDLDVSGDPRRFIPDPSRPFYIKATEISFRVPFKGDPDVFR